MSVISAPKPQYEQIADLLRHRINDGAYPPGTALPSEPDLSLELGVSRVTVNRAMGLLRASGLVRVRRGAGTFVRTLPMIVRDARSRYASRGKGTGAGQVEIAQLGLTSRTVYGHIGQIPAPARVAQPLGLPEGADVLVRRRVLYANDEPTQIADSFYPWHLVAANPPLAEELGPGGSYGWLAAMGLSVARFSEDVTVRMPTDTERTILGIEASQPVFDLDHVARLGDGTPIEVAVHVLTGHLWKLRYSWDDDSIDHNASDAAP